MVFMKRMFFVTLAAMLSVLMLLTACSSPAETESGSGELSTGTSADSGVPSETNESSSAGFDLDFMEEKYQLNADSFVSRENDEYLLYLWRILSRSDWPAYTGVAFGDYTGFGSPSELSLEMLFNIFFAAAEETPGYLEAHYDAETSHYTVPAGDVDSVLGKYFSDYSFDPAAETSMYQYDAETQTITFGGYSVGIDSVDAHVYSVASDENGEITAVIAFYEYTLNSDGTDMTLSAQPTRHVTMRLCLVKGACRCLSMEIVSLG